MSTRASRSQTSAVQRSRSTSRSRKAVRAKKTTLLIAPKKASVPTAKVSRKSSKTDTAAVAVAGKTGNARQKELQASLAELGGAALHDQPCPCVKCAAAAAARRQTPALVWGEYRAHAHASFKNVANAVLCAVVAVPSIWTAATLYQQCDKTGQPPLLTVEMNFSSFESVNALDVCGLAVHYPMVFANFLFFLNVTVGFWLIGVFQRSFWLIDPYWTLIPPLLGVL